MIPAPSLAQADGESGSEAGVVQLGQPGQVIVVTARQREENVQDVPIAISTISSDGLEATGSITLTDISGRVPGLQFGSNAVRLQTFTGIRGVGDYSRNPGFDNRVGIYLDGVYLGRSNATDYPLFDLRQIEILRGPQGTLFGKDTLTGVISMTSAKPEFDFGGRATVRVGSRDHYEGSAVLNAPLGDSAALRLSGLFLRSDGYVFNQFDGEWLGGGDAEGGRIQLRFEPSPDTTIDISADYIHDFRNALLADPLVGTPQGDQAPERRRVNYNFTPTRERHIYGVAANVVHEFPSGHSITSISSFRGVENSFKDNDLDLSSLDLASNRFDDEAEAFSQEIRLASPGGGSIEYVLGLFYYHDNPSSDWLVEVGSQFPAPFIRGESITSQADVSADTYAAFGHGSANLTDRLIFEGGLRLNHIEKEISFQQLGSHPGIGAVLRFPDIPDYQDSLSETWLDPLVGLRFEATEDVTLYATYTSARRPGGWNADFVQYTDIAFDSETVDSYEIGLKSLLFDRVLRFNVAAYIMKFDDLQVVQLLIPPGGSSVAPTITNAGAATSQGVEVEFDIDAGDHFDFGGSVSYNDATFDRFPNADGAGTSYAGRRLIQAPEWIVALNAQAHFPVFAGNAELSFAADYAYQSTTYSDPSNGPLYEQPGRSLFGGRVSLASSDDRWEIAVFARNIFDVTYAQDATVSGLLVPGIVYNEPRRIGAEATIRF